MGKEYNKENVIVDDEAGTISVWLMRDCPTAEEECLSNVTWDNYDGASIKALVQRRGGDEWYFTAGQEQDLDNKIREFNQILSTFKFLD